MVEFSRGLPRWIIVLRDFVRVEHHREIRAQRVASLWLIVASLLSIPLLFPFCAQCGLAASLFS